MEKENTQMNRQTERQEVIRHYVSEEEIIKRDVITHDVITHEEDKGVPNQGPLVHANNLVMNAPIVQNMRDNVGVMGSHNFMARDNSGTMGSDNMQAHNVGNDMRK